MKVLGKIPVLVALCLWMLTTACPKEPGTGPDGMPPMTQKGANTFGCDINGVFYETEGQLFSSQKSLQCYYDQNLDSTVEIYGDNYKNANGYAKSFSINMSKCFKPGKYKLGKKETARYAIFWKNHSNFECCTNAVDSSSLTISKLDTVNKIISGTFDLTVRDSSNRVMRITRGRFDMKYPYPF